MAALTAPWVVGDNGSLEVTEEIEETGLKSAIPRYSQSLGRSWRISTKQEV